MVQYLLAHDVDLGLEVLVPADGIVEFDLLVGEHVKDVSADDLLLVEVLFARDHLLYLVLLLVELSQHLLALILQYQVTSIINKDILSLLSFMLEHLSILICFTLETLHFRLVEAPREAIGLGVMERH